MSARESCGDPGLTPFGQRYRPTTAQAAKTACATKTKSRSQRAKCDSAHGSRFRTTVVGPGSTGKSTPCVYSAFLWFSHHPASFPHVFQTSLSCIFLPGRTDWHGSRTSIILEAAPHIANGLCLNLQPEQQSISRSGTTRCISPKNARAQRGQPAAATPGRAAGGTTATASCPHPMRSLYLKCI